MPGDRGERVLRAPVHPRTHGRTLPAGGRGGQAGHVSRATRPPVGAIFPPNAAHREIGSAHAHPPPARHPLGRRRCGGRARPPRRPREGLPRRPLPPGRAVRRPDPARHHAADAASTTSTGAGQRAARGGARPRTSATSSPRRNDRHQRRRNHSVKARVDGPEGPRALLLPLRDARRRTRPVGRFQTALPPDSTQPVQVRVLLVRGLHARLLQRLRADGATRTSTSSSASATTSTPRPTTRARAAPACATTRSARPTARTPTHRRARRCTLDDYRAKYALYRSDKALRAHAREVPDGHDLGRPRGAGQLRRRTPPAAAWTAASTTRRAPQGAAYKAFFEAMPFFPSGPQPHLPRAALRRATST